MSSAVPIKKTTRVVEKGTDTDSTEAKAANTAIAWRHAGKPFDSS